MYGGGAIVGEQVAADADRAARVGHVDDRPLVVRRDLHRGVHAARRRAADQQRDLLDAEEVVALHLGGDVLHLLEARRDQARQADDVGALDLRLARGCPGTATITPMLTTSKLLHWINLGQGSAWDSTSTPRSKKSVAPARPVARLAYRPNSFFIMS